MQAVRTISPSKALAALEIMIREESWDLRQVVQDGGRLSGRLRRSRRRVAWTRD